jgi:hypothetical protein
VIREEEDAALLEADGYPILGGALGMVVDAKKIEKLLYDVNASGQSFLQTDTAAFSALADSFAQKADKIAELANDAAQLDREGIDETKKEYMTYIIEDAETYKEICGDMLSMIQAGSTDGFTQYTTEASDGERFNPVEQLSVVLKNLVDGFNFLVG